MYTLQRHNPSGEVYLLQRTHYGPDGTDAIIGVCGPLHHSDWSNDDGKTVTFPEDPAEVEFNGEDAIWANAQQWQYPLKTWG